MTKDKLQRLDPNDLLEKGALAVEIAKNGWNILATLANIAPDLASWAISAGITHAKNQYKQICTTIAFNALPLTDTVRSQVIQRYSKDPIGIMELSYNQDKKAVQQNIVSEASSIFQYPIPMTWFAPDETPFQDLTTQVTKKGSTLHLSPDLDTWTELPTLSLTLSPPYGKDHNAHTIRLAKAPPRISDLAKNKLQGNTPSAQTEFFMASEGKGDSWVYSRQNNVTTFTRSLDTWENETTRTLVDQILSGKIGPFSLREPLSRIKNLEIGIAKLDATTTNSSSATSQKVDLTFLNPKDLDIKELHGVHAVIHTQHREGRTNNGQPTVVFELDLYKGADFASARRKLQQYLVNKGYGSAKIVRRNPFARE